MEGAQYNRPRERAWQKRRKTGRDMQRRTRPSVSTLGGAAPERSSDVLPRIARERVPTVVYCFCAPSIFSNFFTFGATTSRQYP